MTCFRARSTGWTFVLLLVTFIALLFQPARTFQCLVIVALLTIEL